jgi:hypothetical protein
LAYFLDGQYDRAVEDSSRKEHLFEGVPIFESRGQELMRARAFAARGSYEEALRLYSDLEKRPSTWSTLAVSDEQPFEGLGFTVTIEPAALQCKLGRLREAAELLTKHFAMGPSIDFRRRIYHVKDFEEEALKKSQEVLFPHGPTDPLSLIFYVALKGPDAPPITRMRESVKLSRVVHDVGEQLGVETNKYGRPFKMIEGYRRLPSLIGGFVFLVARSQRAAEFTRQIRVRADIEQIECFDHIYP